MRIVHARLLVVSAHGSCCLIHQWLLLLRGYGSVPLVDAAANTLHPASWERSGTHTAS